MPDEPEPLRRAQVHLHEEFDNVITRAVLEYDLTIADIVGVLECVKYNFLRRMDDECEGCEAEGGDGDGTDQ